MKGEVWKSVVGYEDSYQISNFGRVKSLPREMWNGWNFFTSKELILKLQEDYKGYYTIGLAENGNRKTMKVHRLVAQAFIPNPNNLPFINHKDENPKNNNVDNLEWCTPLYNNLYKDAHIRGGLVTRNHKNTSKPIQQLSLEGVLIKEYPSMQQAQREGYNQSSISRCCSGQYSHHKGYKWRYVDETNQR